MEHMPEHLPAEELKFPSVVTTNDRAEETEYWILSER